MTIESEELMIKKSNLKIFHIVVCLREGIRNQVTRFVDWKLFDNLALASIIAEIPVLATRITGRPYSIALIRS